MLAACVLLMALAPSYNFARFAGELVDLEALARVDFVPTRMVSSYDRTGGNNDAFVGAWKKGDVYTFAEMEGPGVIRRIYSARPGGHLKIFVDGSATPIVDMRSEEFFSGRHYPFVRPMVGPMGGSNYCYFPIPYAKSVRIQTTPVRPAEFPWGVYYQVTYQTFPKSARVKSLRLPLEPEEDAEWRRVTGIWKTPGTDPKPAARDPLVVEKRVEIGPGKRVEIVGLEGAGVIDALFLKLEPADAALLRSTLLKIHWDEETKDSVDCPVGDFFGNGFNRAPYKSLVMGLTEEGYYSYFSMPYGRRAAISLVNQSADRVITASLKVAYHKAATLPENVGYFHAKWRREEVVATDLDYENRSGEYNYRVLDARGQGRYVGLNLNVYNRHTLWWGEGDPMIFVDNETWPPSIHGTGTEEYFNDGWGFHQYISVAGAEPGKQERNVVPVSGVLVGGVDEPNECFGGNAIFSFHIADSIPFRERIVVSFEHGQEQNDLTNDYASTAYWYARPRARDFFFMRPAWERVTVPEGEWAARRKEASPRYTQWLRETLAEFAAAIPYEPNNDRLARPRAVFLMWTLQNAEKLGLAAAERDRVMREWKAARGTEAERRRQVDRWLLDIAGKLGLRRE